MPSDATELDAGVSRSPELRVRLGGLVKETFAVGPGLRDAVFFQGCTIDCAGCANRDFLPQEGGHDVRVALLVEHFRRRAGRIDGVSILGGEPTEQPAALGALVSGAKRFGLSTVVFTGRLYEELAADPAFDQVLANTDLLIDGPFIQKESSPELHWRGSANQRMLRLSERFSDSDLVPAGPTREVIIGLDRLVLHGFRDTRAVTRIGRSAARIGGEEGS